jgi:lipopolysaccharide/colanic/teichoic acid biosynthesis glycosyltransferase
MAGVELFLLLEPTQLVLFDLTQLAEAMVWNRAIVTRVRVLESHHESFREEVITSNDGIVQRIQRCYGPSATKDYRVLLTRSAAAAAAWAGSATRRDGWTAVREIAGRRLASERVYGQCFEKGSGGSKDSRRLVDRLVATWEDPDRAIDGVEEIEPGIWAVAGTRLDQDTICTAPAWIGYAPKSGHTSMLAGPVWSADSAGVIPGSVPIRLLSIAEIMPPQSSKRSAEVPRRQLYELLKRAGDIIAAFLVLLFTLPISVAIALAIVIDDGLPLFFGHERQARNGDNFRCWKFRTMRRDAESMVASLSALDRADGPQVYIQDDPRVTRVGRVLRKYHLDELPQFWNVMVGEMSLVGPRPSPERENQFCPAWREIRLSVRPGITGLWQVERTRAPGRDFQEWIRYDIEYVRRASVWLDLIICFRTVRNILSRG